jgi:hypothetical protein
VEVQLTSGKTLDEGQLVCYVTTRPIAAAMIVNASVIIRSNLTGSSLRHDLQVLLASKLGLERSLADVEAIKSQLEEVAKFVATQAPSSSVVIANSQSGSEVTVVHNPAASHILLFHFVVGTETGKQILDFA